MALGLKASALYLIALSCDLEEDVWQHIGMCYFEGCLKPDGGERGRERDRENVTVEPAFQLLPMGTEEIWE